MIKASWLGLVCFAACANNVPQDRATGPDGKIKGALPVALDQGEGKVRGIVTYPGGDRVDWKLIELPAGERGRLDLQMSWTTPRPGLKVAFDVFDQWNVPVVNASSNARTGRTRSASIDRAMGKYFVRIYAPRRMDAGAYTLQAAFMAEDKKPDDIAKILALQISDPPKLPDVPPPPSTCETHDPHDRACDTVCAPGAPLTWKGCVPPPPPTVTTVTPPLPPVQLPDPVLTRVLKFEVTSAGLEITVAAGSAHGVGKTWKANVLRGTTMSTLAGGTGTILRVNKQTTIILVNLTTNAVNANPQVQLSP
jgi:hypothetical protein